MRTTRTLRDWAVGAAIGLVLGTALSVEAQGPFSAQIQRAINALTAGSTGFTQIKCGSSVGAVNQVLVGGNPCTWAGSAIIVAQGRSTAQTGAVVSVTTYTPTVDMSFIVDANVLVTGSTNHNFTVTVAYTDEGNTPRTLNVPFSLSTGGLTTAISNANGADAYSGLSLHIRAKANTSITVATTGTFTTVTYNVEAVIRRTS